MNEQEAKDAAKHEMRWLTGATGEPGDWNGPLPVRKLIAENQRLRTALEQLRDHPRQYCCCAEVELVKFASAALGGE